ncbi:MAG TPA: hypothetical protein VFN29_13535 [Chiayiivirga sp.]|nr:hypothetical protein [Chiayiivirga sp.]
MPKPITVRAFLLLSLGLALLSGLLFTPSLPGSFVFDDIPNIVNNESIHLHELNAAAIVDLLATPQVSGTMRSLPTLSFALDYWRAGGVADPATFKVTNILIHALTAFALAWLFRRVLLLAKVSDQRAPWLAAALALAWAAHPLLVSSVLYAVQRLQTMGTLFLVLALLAYLEARRAQIDGQSGRSGLLLAGLMWALALGCKEDSTLLPAYTLALELTVLRFAAADAAVTRTFKRGYALLAIAGVLTYLLWVVPHYWNWNAYAGRDYSTAERLLTQPRMLCLYLWQILWPLPSHMPFYYDWVEPSRGLWRPWTTVPAMALVLGMLCLAWRVRHLRPLLALGIFWFFAAHAITSNVIGLELAFEHRNHFALIGAVLAAGSLLADIARRLTLSMRAQTGACAVLLLGLGGATMLRAHHWSDPLLLAEAGTVAAPSSARAWIDLCSARLDAGGGVQSAHNPQLDAAINACQAGTDAAPDSLNNPAKLIVLKTLRGDDVTSDWARFQQRLQTVRMSWDNARAPMILTYYASLGVKLDTAQVLQSLATLTQRARLKPITLARIGLATLDDLDSPHAAKTYLLRAVEASEPGDPLASQIAEELRAQGHHEMALSIERAGLLHAQSQANTP